DDLQVVVGIRTHAVHVADAVRVVGIGEVEFQVGGEMVGLTPERPQHVLDRLPDAVVAGERSERGTDVPDAVFPPDRQETREVAFVEAVAVLADEVPQRVPTLQLVDPSLQLLQPCLAHPLSPRTLEAVERPRTRDPIGPLRATIESYLLSSSKHLLDSSKPRMMVKRKPRDEQMRIG